MLELKKKYNVTTLAPSVLGAEFKLVTVTSIMTDKQAVAYRDVYTLNANLLPIITNMSVNAADHIYYLLKDVNGKEIVLADSWIDTSVVVEGVNIRAEVTDASTEDIRVIESTLRALGYNLQISTF